MAADDGDCASASSAAASAAAAAASMREQQDGGGSSSSRLLAQGPASSVRHAAAGKRGGGGQQQQQQQEEEGEGESADGGKGKAAAAGGTGAAGRGRAAGGGGGGGGGGGAAGKKKDALAEARRDFARKLKAAQAEGDAAMEKLRREHQTEIGRLREARERRFREYEAKLAAAAQEATRLKGLLLSTASASASSPAGGAGGLGVKGGIGGLLDEESVAGAGAAGHAAALGGGGGVGVGGVSPVRMDVDEFFEGLGAAAAVAAGAGGKGQRGEEDEDDGDAEALRDNPHARVLALKEKLKEARGELDLANQLFHDVSLHCSTLKREVNAAKDVLINVGSAAFPDVLPTVIFCEATPEEVERALLEGRRQAAAAQDGSDMLASALDELEEVAAAEELTGGGDATASAGSSTTTTTDGGGGAFGGGSLLSAPTTRTHPVYGNNPNKHYLVPIKLLDRAMETVDLAVRDARFDPFLRRDGEIASVDWEHERLQELATTYGRPLAELVVEKKREVERYCPSGAYPTPVLFLQNEQRELPLPEAILRCLDALLQATGRAGQHGGHHHGSGHSSTTTASAASSASASTALPPSLRGSSYPAHIIHHSGPHAFLQVDPSLRDTLPYLTRCSVQQQGEAMGAGDGATAPNGHTGYPGPVPDSVGHIFVRWLRVAKEVEEEAGWKFLRRANAALARLPLRPSDRQGACQSEEEVRRWLEARRDACDALVNATVGRNCLDRASKVAVRALQAFIFSRHPTKLHINANKKGAEKKGGKDKGAKTTGHGRRRRGGDSSSDDDEEEEDSSSDSGSSSDDSGSGSSEEEEGSSSGGGDDGGGGSDAAAGSGSEGSSLSGSSGKKGKRRRRRGRSAGSFASGSEGEGSSGSEEEEDGEVAAAAASGMASPSSAAAAAGAASLASLFVGGGGFFGGSSGGSGPVPRLLAMYLRRARRLPRGDVRGHICRALPLLSRLGVPLPPPSSSSSTSSTSTTTTLPVIKQEAIPPPPPNDDSSSSSGGSSNNSNSKRRTRTTGAATGAATAGPTVDGDEGAVAAVAAWAAAEIIPRLGEWKGLLLLAASSAAANPTTATDYPPTPPSSTPSSDHGMDDEDEEGEGEGGVATGGGMGQGEGEEGQPPKRLSAAEAETLRELGRFSLALTRGRRRGGLRDEAEEDEAAVEAEVKAWCWWAAQRPPPLSTASGQPIAGSTGLSQQMRKSFELWCHKPPRALAPVLARYASREASSLVRDVVALTRAAGALTPPPTPPASSASSSNSSSREGGGGGGKEEEEVGISRSRHRALRSQVQARTLLTHVLTTNNPTTAARPLVAALLRDAGHARREAWALFCRFVGVEWEGEREGLEGEGGFETDGEEGEGEGSEGWMARAVGAGAGEGEEEVVMDVDGEEEEGGEGGKAKKGKGGKSKGKSHKGKKSRRGGEGVRVEVEIAPTIRKRFKQHLGRQGQRVKKARDAVVEEALACLGTLLALTTRPPSSSSAKQPQQPQQPQQHTFTKRGQIRALLDGHQTALLQALVQRAPLAAKRLKKGRSKKGKKGKGGKKKGVKLGGTVAVADPATAMRHLARFLELPHLLPVLSGTKPPGPPTLTGGGGGSSKVKPDPDAPHSHSHHGDHHEAEAEAQVALLPDDELPPLPPLPDALCERFEGYLSRTEGLTNPWPYSVALATLYEKLLAHRLKRVKTPGGQKAAAPAKACLAEAARRKTGPSIPTLAALLRPAKDGVVRQLPGFASHREREALRYFLDWATELSHRSTTAASTTTDDATKGGKATTTTTTTTTTTSKKRKLPTAAEAGGGEDGGESEEEEEGAGVEMSAHSRLRQEAEWRSLSLGIMQDFGRWLELVKGIKGAPVPDPPPASLPAAQRAKRPPCEAALVFVDSMFKTLVTKHNTLLLKGDVRRLAKGYPAHLERLTTEASDEEKRAWGLFREYAIADDRWEAALGKTTAVSSSASAASSSAASASQGREKRPRRAAAGGGGGK